jgi:hypothetical protein
MGLVISTLISAWKTIRTIVAVLRDLNTKYNALLDRAHRPAPLPSANPTTSFWQLRPPHPELTNARSPVLPRTADVVVVGSGITGAAVARSLLRLAPRRVVVLEAREICSGATGRNGGHIKASPHETLGHLLQYGLAPERAAALVRFQLRHVDLLTTLCAEESIAEAECRAVETVDLFTTEAAWAEAVEKVDMLKTWVPEFDMVVWEGDAASEVSPNQWACAP